MRLISAVVLSVGALVVGGVSAAAAAGPGPSLHGHTDYFTSPHVTWSRLIVNTTQLPNGDLAGEINFFSAHTQLWDFNFLHATPIYFAVDGNTACVVGHVTNTFPPEASGFEPPPWYILLKVVDVPGGPDLFGSVTFAFPVSDWASWCSLMGAGPTSGDFTVNS